MSSVADALSVNTLGEARLSFLSSVSENISGPKQSFALTQLVSLSFPGSILKLREMEEVKVGYPRLAKVRIWGQTRD